MHRGAKKHIALAALFALPFPALICHAEAAAPMSAEDHVFTYHQQNVLGTALDLKIVAPSQADADACHSTIDHEIERLRLILSTYDPQSEISKVQANPSTGAITVSDDLHAVLLDYLKWHAASGGAFSAQLGELIDFWTAAEKKAVIPTDEELAPLVAKVKQNSFVTSPAGLAVRRITTQALNIDSLGKGYIVQKAAALARARHPLVSGILLNIGGDITALGMSTPPGAKAALPWTITVADPLQPSINGPAVANLKLTNKAIATSGVYERFYTFGDTKLSHILNPLTGRPSNNDVLSATVVAGDNAMANALATILCVVPVTDGIKLVEKTPGAAALVVMAGGKQARSKGFSAYEPDGVPSTPLAAKPADSPTAPPAGATGIVSAANAWPANFMLSIDLTLIQWRRPTFIPYVTMWIEDSNGKCVKIVAAWVGNKKYLQALRNFNKVASAAGADFTNMTRATRKTGEYNIAWDGKDAAGNAVPTGNYSVCVEVGYDGGGHGFQRLPVTCEKTPFTAQIPACSVWQNVPVAYGAAK